MTQKKLIYLCVAIVLLVIVIIFAWDRKTAHAPAVSMMATTTTTSVGQTSSTTKNISTTNSGTSTISVVLSTSTPKSYANGSFSMVYPGAWTIYEAEPFSMNDFNGKYYNGGIIPKGGAEIDVVTTTVYSSVQNIMDTELMSAVAVSTSTVSVDSVSCDKASYQDTYGPGVISQNIALYCLRGTELWKIYLSYYANDPTGAAHISDFNGILASMKLLSQ